MADFIENEGVEYPQEQPIVVPQPEAVVEQTEEQKTEEQTPVIVDDKPKEEIPAVEPESDLVVLLDEEPIVTETEPVVTGLSDVFGDDVKTKEEAKQYVESLKTKVETLEKQGEEVFANDTVKALNDYMKKGGADEKAFLDTKFAQKQITANIEQLKAVDPIALYKEDLKVNQGLTEDEVEMYIATKSDIELKIEGKKLQKDYLSQLENTLSQSQQQEVDMIKSVEVRQQRFKEKIESYVGELKEVGGVQVDESDKKKILTNLSNAADYIRKNFPLDKDGLPTKEWVANAAKLETHTRLVSNLRNKVTSAKADGAKEAFNQLHNIPKNEATAQKVSAGGTEVSEGEKIAKLLEQRGSANHYN